MLNSEQSKQHIDLQNVAGADLAMPHNFEKLKEYILPLSNASDFNDAKAEWDLVGIDIVEGSSCPCGKKINERCFIKNRINGEVTFVGNMCVKHFGIETGNSFDGLKRISESESANANADLIEHAWKMGYLYGREEYDFMMTTVRGRCLSPKQRGWRIKVNRRILKKIKVR